MGALAIAWNPYLTMWLPHPVYKALPVVYATVGVALTPLFGFSVPILLSSALFLAAGALTVWWRHKYRDKPPSMQELLRSSWARRRARRIAALRAMDLK